MSVRLFEVLFDTKTLPYKVLIPSQPDRVLNSKYLFDIFLVSANYVIFLLLIWFQTW